MISGFRMPARRRVLPVIALLAIPGCTDLRHTNPMHPFMDVTVTVVGPDTLTSVNQPFDLTVETSPEWDDPPLTWDTGLLNYFVTDVPRGRRFSIQAHEWRDTIRFTVFAGPHRASKVVAMDQRFAILGFVPCPANTCVAYLDAPPPGLHFVGLRHFDAGGEPMLDPSRVPASVAASLISRDTTILSVNHGASNRDQVAVAARSQGSTWIVSSVHGLDSVRVYSDFTPTTMQMGCPSSVAVDETVQLTATPVGAGGESLITPHIIVWSGLPPGSDKGSLSPSGLLTPFVDGTLEIVAAWPGVLSGSCTINVTAP